MDIPVVAKMKSKLGFLKPVANNFVSTPRTLIHIISPLCVSTLNRSNFFDVELLTQTTAEKYDLNLYPEHEIKVSGYSKMRF